MSSNELQEEEREALEAIFECDEYFTKTSDTKFSYKIKDEDNLENSNNNFLVEFEWGENYPEEIPIINLDSFFNCHLTERTKATILEKLNEEAENNIGISMIYTLIEYAKENREDLTQGQLEREEKEAKEVEVAEKKTKDKKEHMTKKQKSRLQDRMVDGELPRGWDWVCLIRHLSQSYGFGL